MKRRILLIVLGLLMVSQVANATGLLVPKDKSYAPLAIKYHRVRVDIKDQVAKTHVEQVFQNHVDRDLEAIYIFPLPAGASVSDFAMYMNGKRISGELIEKNQARQIYQDIVRRMRDPGLLEYMGNNLFKASIYPVPRKGTQKIELTYSQVLTKDAEMVSYIYPLKTAEKASQTMEDFSVAVNLESREPIRTIYSPSHKIGVSKKDDHHAMIGFEEERGTLDRDFVLYYTVSDKDFGLNLLTHREKGEDGYFMVMISPKYDIAQKEVLAKDMVFVFDTSGSMSDNNKIGQARNALKYCLNNLNPKDRFSIIRFSTDVQTFGEGLLKVTKENVAAAVTFANELPARGGTNINDALQTALSLPHKDGRPFIVVFLTDGKPTVGETDIEAIVKSVASAKRKDTRVFVFGVGDAVNTHLLDKIAEEGKGVTEYVRPNDDIEVKVSSFYNKASEPVLSNLALDFGSMKVTDVYPTQLPDLFKGMQLIVTGRYHGNSDTAIRLTGEVNGRRKELVYEGTFPEVETANAFVGRTWATRKVGYLLDNIRLNGEEPELKGEVIRLSQEFGIITPYTSYLVLEEGELARRGIRVPRVAGKGGAPSPASAPVEWDEVTRARNEARDDTEKEAGEKLNNQSGADSVATSQAVGNFKKANAGSEGFAYSNERRDRSIPVRRARKRNFYLTADYWVDGEYKQEMKITKIKYASDAYFKLLDARPELKDYLAVGAKLVLVISDTQCIQIDDDGTETLTDEEIAELFKA